jgi:hypothetical protein
MNMALPIRDLSISEIGNAQAQVPSNGLSMWGKGLHAPFILLNLHTVE